MAPRVFISYTHDSDEHREAVRDLWVFLRSCGIDAQLDWAAAQTRMDWALWAANQIRESDHILVIASPGYRARAEARRNPDAGRGVQWEARLIRDAFYSDQNALTRFIPVVLPGQTVDGVPDFLASNTSSVYHVRDFTVTGAEPLLRLLTEQPYSVEPLAGPWDAKLRTKILVLATEWSSARGGLSTLNRQLCCALAERNTEVVCMVVHGSDADHREARAKGVTLCVATRPPGGSDQAGLSSLTTIPNGFRPDYIVGHSRVTGPAAHQIAEHFPAAKRLHFIHMAPDEIEWHKPGRTDDAGERSEVRYQIELELARTAHCAVAVGPRLYNRYLRDLSQFNSARVTCLVPGFDQTDSDLRTPPPGAPWKILVAGRAEDVMIKGIDVAARAIGLTAQKRAANLPRIELVVRGALHGESEKLRQQILEWAELPSLDVVVRPYSANQESLAGDLKTSTLVLMPSRQEGFGLIGLEAITAGVPVLVSASSGLGEHLQSVLDPEETDRIVIPVTGDINADGEYWSRAVYAALFDRTASFNRAAVLRRTLAEHNTWAHAATELLASV